MLISLFEMSSVLVRNLQLDELEVGVNQLIYVSYIPHTSICTSPMFCLVFRRSGRDSCSSNIKAVAAADTASSTSAVHRAQGACGREAVEGRRRIYHPWRQRTCGATVLDTSARLWPFSDSGPKVVHAVLIWNPISHKGNKSFQSCPHMRIPCACIAHNSYTVMYIEAKHRCPAVG